MRLRAAWGLLAGLATLHATAPLDPALPNYRPE